MQIVNAIILTYDCDLHRILRRICAGEARVPEDVSTVAAVFEPAPDNPQLGNIVAGRMPLYTYLPATTRSPAYVVDFTTIQNVDMRMMLQSIKKNGRVQTLRRPYGQWRLLETLAQALGDVFRRGAAGPDDEPTLLRRALELV
jgi:hypothetical protein